MAVEIGGHLPHQTWGALVDDTVDVLRSWPTDRRRELAARLARAERGDLSPEEALASVAKDVPAVEPYFSQFRGNPSLQMQLVALLIGILMFVNSDAGAKTLDQLRQLAEALAAATH